MTNNEFITCSTCHHILNLRIQMGQYTTPFNVYCPECSTHISGSIEFEPEYKISLENATQSEVDPGFPIWCIEISAEFPTRKFYYRKSQSGNLTPYLNTISLLGSYKEKDEEVIKDIRDSMKFAQYCANGQLINLIRLHELFWNYKYDYLFPELDKLLLDYKDLTPLSASKVSNAVDAMMVLHQLLVTTTGVESFIGEKLNEYTELSKRVYERKYSVEILEYADYMYPKFNSIERKGIEILKNFSEIYTQIMPVITLKNSSSYENFDHDSYGISTVDYEMLTKFYGKSYEWILDNINLCIGLNNIYTRGSYRNGYGKTPEKYKDYHEKLEKISIKYNKLEQYLRKDEPFSKPMGNINNKIRNAIQHYSSEVDYVKQKITFTDISHKGEVTTQAHSFVEFALLCVENMSFVLYLLEIIYNLRKVYLLDKGLNMTLILDREKVVYASPYDRRVPRRTFAIGRNEKCPCGSGRKYKKCCGKNYTSLLPRA